MALALLALALARQKRVWFVGAAAIAGFAAAMGEHGLLYPGLVKLIPWLGCMRYPIKFAFLTAFALPVLAGLGLDRVKWLVSRDWPKAVRWTLGLGCLVVLVIAVLTWQGALNAYRGVSPSALVLNGLGRFVFLTLLLPA